MPNFIILKQFMIIFHHSQTISPYLECLLPEIFHRIVIPVFFDPFHEIGRHLTFAAFTKFCFNKCELFVCSVCDRKNSAIVKNKTVFSFCFRSNSPEIGLNRVRDTMCT